MQSPCADEPVICPPTQRAFFRFGRDVLLPNVDETAQVSDLIVRTAQWGQGSTRAVEDGRFLVGYGCGGFGIYYGNLWNLYETFFGNYFLDSMLKLHSRT